MLRFLSIRNLAVIDRLELEFEPGLNVLTGETGAGKSILVGAVGLLVGGRASAELVRTGEDQAAIEAVFEGPGGEELVVRRDISSQTGRSRAFMNGALVTSTALRDAAAQLVDLHGQHEHQVLLDPASHLDLLDAFAGLETERENVEVAFARVQSLAAERERLALDIREKARREEYLQFQLTEIRRAAPKPGEDDELTTSRQVLANAERLQRLCAEAYTGLYEGDGAVLPALATVWKRVIELASIDPQFEPYLSARETVKSQLEDLAYFLRSYSAGFDASPARLQEVEDRLAVLERLKKKHGPRLQDVIDTEASLTRELGSLEQSGQRASELDGELDAARTVYLRLAEALSAKRQSAATTFSERLVASLGDLAMTRTRCEVRFAAPRGQQGWTARGVDEAEFYISPNPGEDLRPLARIASGGELSRLMLALKTLASTDAPGKTLIFDEVDAGIGGTVADIVGARLRELAGQCQVLCITHLPQIAAYGGTHYRIEKALKGGRTVTSVTRLAVREREDELARMIAGSEISASVRASAREMLKKKGAAAAP
ncbi:MAG TPA: DNA repair protein RecN [Vicinamibacterales bacterium]|nr:DNA repair protein RecN [Vicinamibacterales bacterium]